MALDTVLTTSIFLLPWITVNSVVLVSMDCFSDISVGFSDLIMDDYYDESDLTGVDVVPQTFLK